METLAETLDIADRQLWTTAFWGFQPENSGTIGFTDENDRDRFFNECRDGDLVLIYGASSPEVNPKDRRALGFLEIRKQKTFDERMSVAHREWKVKKGKADSWKYGLPISRAWKIVQTIPMRSITDTNIDVAVRGKLLEGQERDTALALRVVPTNVYGEEPVIEIGEPIQMNRAIKGPKGFQPTFGTFEGERVDGVHYLYMMIASGPVATVLGLTPEVLGKRKLVKIGYSKNPPKRCKTFNDALPNTFTFRWTLHPDHVEFPNGQAARDAEKAVHDRVRTFSEYLGGEFFLGDFNKIHMEFYLNSGGSKIVGRTIR